jgi:hypothetical protein
MAELSPALKQAVDDYYGNLPHPLAPSIRAREYPAYAKIAAMFKDGMPDGKDVEAAAQMLRGIQLAPSEFEYLWKIARPVANRLTGQDPHPIELQRLKNASPAEIAQYYGSLPHRDYPEISSADFARYHHAMTPIARQHVQRDPVALEVARAAAAGWSHEDIGTFYRGKR